MSTVMPIYGDILAHNSNDARRNCWRAKNEAGQYLHLSGEFFVDGTQWAWRGNLNQFEAMMKKHPGLIRVHMNTSDPDRGTRS